MNHAVSDAPGVSTGLSGPTAIYAAELTALSQRLKAAASDLGHLLVPIHVRQPPRQQVYGLLSQAWLRLCGLRESQAELASLAGDDPETVHLIEQAFDALQAGSSLCPEAADSAFDNAGVRWRAYGGPPALGAGIRAAQAQIAAIGLDLRGAAERYADAAATPQLSRPLQWRYQLQRASVLADLGREFIDNAALEEAIALYETRVLPLAPRTQRPADWAATQDQLGDALGTLGQRQRGTRLLEKSIEAFGHALSARDRARTPMDWAATQNSLGNALGLLAQRHNDTAMLEQSIGAFAAALEERTRDGAPQDWAVTQNNHAAALLALGQRRNDTTLLKQATDTYKNVLQVWTRERSPLDWASTLDRLGTALRVLGEHRKGPRTLEQSVAAFRSALSERTRERVPQDWAMTQNNLGAALQRLGIREQQTHYLEAAITAYANALEEWSRERGPVTWAMCMANRAAARKALAELSGDADLVRQALAEFIAVASVFREASHAQYYELATEQVALLRKLEKQLAVGSEG